MDTLGEYTDDRADLRTSLIPAPARPLDEDGRVST
jgi:hypothetical protein